MKSKENSGNSARQKRERKKRRRKRAERREKLRPQQDAYNERMRTQNHPGWNPSIRRYS